MQSAAPSSEWDDDAITMLAEYAGWSVLRIHGEWHFQRPLDEFAFEVIHADTDKEALYYLSGNK